MGWRCSVPGPTRLSVPLRPLPVRLARRAAGGRAGIPGRDHALGGAVRAARRGRRLSGPGGRAFTGCAGSSRKRAAPPSGPPGAPRLDRNSLAHLRRAAASSDSTSLIVKGGGCPTFTLSPRSCGQRTEFAAISLPPVVAAPGDRVLPIRVKRGRRREGRSASGGRCRSGGSAWRTRRPAFRAVPALFLRPLRAFRRPSTSTFAPY